MEQQQQQQQSSASAHTTERILAILQTVLGDVAYERRPSLLVGLDEIISEQRMREFRIMRATLLNLTHLTPEDIGIVNECHKASMAALRMDTTGSSPVGIGIEANLRIAIALYVTFVCHMDTIKVTMKPNPYTLQYEVRLIADLSKLQLEPECPACVGTWGPAHFERLMEALRDPTDADGSIQCDQCGQETTAV